MKQDFSRRSQQPELMDTEQVSFKEFHDCLRDLEYINIRSLAYRPTLRWIDRVQKTLGSGAALSILDIGSGGGDMLRRIWRSARKRNSEIILTGVDLNPWSRRAAEQSTPCGYSIRYETCNIFDFDPERRADIIISSLFTHHLTDDELVRFIQWMDHHASLGWFINDLHRHPVPYYFIKFISRWLRLNRLVQHDGPVSVARAFVADDWRLLLSRAGIAAERATITWHFPFRFGVACRKS